MHARVSYECPDCGTFTEQRDATPVYLCDRCESIWDTEDEAEACCPDAPAEE